MIITGDLIERFFNKQCTVEEAKHVAAYLKKYPNALDEYLYVSEWNEVQLNESLPAEVCEEVWQNIESKNKKSVLVVALQKSAVAAGIVGALCLGYYQFALTKEDTAGQPLANNNITIAKAERKMTSNSSKHVMKIVLPDSSVVHLSPGAIIEYNVPFQNNKREIYFTGKALFNVAKDKTKPFTVYTGSLTTTALGTTFRITTKKNSPDNINVKLYTGKVIIKSTRTGLKGWSKDVYLLPGQQMHYNGDKILVNVEKIINNNPVKKPVVKVQNKKYLPPNVSELSFTGAPLPDVINRLSEYFTETIEFSEGEIRTMSFTGTINKKDSLSNVLKLIGQMNDIDISKKDGKFILQKIKK